MKYVDNIVGLTTNEPIDLNANGVRKQAFINCDDVIRTEDNWALMTKLSSSQAIVPLENSHIFTTSINEVVVDIGDILVQTPMKTPLQTPMKATMHNVVKTLMHDPMQKLQTPNSINEGI
jgi:hypothetical protein